MQPLIQKSKKPKRYLVANAYLDVVCRDIASPRTSMSLSFIFSLLKMFTSILFCEKRYLQTFF